MFNILSFLILSFFMLNQATFAGCDIHSTISAERKDAIAILLTSSVYCPKNVFELRKAIKEAGLQIQTTMVANEGYHNPTNGSFSFFEIVSGRLNALDIQSGDFFFGHFTTVDENNNLTADQGPTDEARLMIEAFAWDPQKGLFNFYELMGDGKNNQWFYRGDSADIYADNSSLHLQIDPAHPQFGNRLRCSGCHDLGGPIMKELDTPHNDWWEPKRKLDFGGRGFNPAIIDIMNNLVPAEHLSQSVKTGMKKIITEGKIQKLSLQEKLRPLFCPVEVNLMSDSRANDEKNPVIEIPIEFFVNKKFINTKHSSISIMRSAYEKALYISKSHFPGTSLSDADHAWLTPIKAASDQNSIDRMIQTGLINEKFVYDVLSIEMTNPIFSHARCQLLQYIPKSWTSDWQAIFKMNLKSARKMVAYKLVQEMENSTHTPAYHREKAQQFLTHCHEKLKNQSEVQKLFLLLLQRREEIRASEISKNKRGQILEPGFRVIFPETATKSIPGQWKLSEECEVYTSS